MEQEGFVKREPEGFVRSTELEGPEPVTLPPPAAREGEGFVTQPSVGFVPSSTALPGVSAALPRPREAFVNAEPFHGLYRHP